MPGLAIWLFFLLAAAPPAVAADAHQVGNWLSGKAFCGPGIALALDQDGFFALRMETRKPVQNVTGLWRLANDGIELTLFNHQDANLKLSVGKAGLHASFGKDAQLLLVPKCEGNLHFRVTGVLEKARCKFRLVDAASGRSFDVIGPPSAQPGKFATADIEFGQGFTKPGRLVRHSAPVPRFFTPPAGSTGLEVFKKDVADKYWLLPPDLISEKATLRFSAPNGGQPGGDFEITGRGLRLEGNYQLDGEKLTLVASRASLRDLEIIGLKTLAQRLPGQFNWRLSSRGLEFSGNGGSLLFLAH